MPVSPARLTQVMMALRAAARLALRCGGRPNNLATVPAATVLRKLRGLSALRLLSWTATDILFLAISALSLLIPSGSPSMAGRSSFMQWAPPFAPDKSTNYFDILTQARQPANKYGFVIL